jgi:hypothetical protein
VCPPPERSAAEADYGAIVPDVNLENQMQIAELYLLRRGVETKTMLKI